MSGPGRRRRARARRRIAQGDATAVRQFSAVELRNLDVRTIAVLHKPGDQPAVTVAIWRDGRELTRRLIHQCDLATVRAALAVAQDRATHERRHVGTIEQGATALDLYACGGPSGCVALQRRAVASGARVGREVPLVGEELAALANATRCARIQPTAPTHESATGAQGHP